MTTLTVNRQRKAQRIADTIDRLLAHEVAAVAGDIRQASVLDLIDRIDDLRWAELAHLTDDQAPSTETRAIVRTILEERYSPVDPFDV